jgi:lipopolysaccharide export system protein LptC
MSSPTETSGRTENGRAARAVRFASTARLLSYLAGAIGIGAFLLFLFQAGLFSAFMPKEKLNVPVIENPDSITARTSTVTGLDQENQPYEVTAKRGRQDAVKPNIVYLDDIAAVFRKPGGKVYNVTAASGIYDDKAKDVNLEGHVVISEATSFTARMEKAYVQIETKAMTSDVPVTVDMVGGGTIAANGMQITNDGTKILFLNGVKARFGAETGKGDQTP